VALRSPHAKGAFRFRKLGVARLRAIGCRHSGHAAACRSSPSSSPEFSASESRNCVGENRSADQNSGRRHFFSVREKSVANAGCVCPRDVWNKNCTRQVVSTFGWRISRLGAECFIFFGKPSPWNRFSSSYHRPRYLYAGRSWGKQWLTRIEFTIDFSGPPDASSNLFDFGARGN